MLGSLSIIFKCKFYWIKVDDHKIAHDKVKDMSPTAYNKLWFIYKQKEYFKPIIQRWSEIEATSFE